MKQVCPNCGAPISKRWLLLGSLSDTYICPNCKSEFEWTWKRYLFSFLVGLIGALPIPIIFYFDFHGLSWLTIGIIYAGILIFNAFFILSMPGQFKPLIDGKKFYDQNETIKKIIK